jgi:peptide/nickel transport system substrate-binding protein
MNCYDTLIFYDGERLDRYMPQLATEWSLTTHNPPVHQADTGLDWYATYTFKIRTGVQFHDPLWGNLMTTDVEFCFERGMVLDMDFGPQWNFYEPLLNGANAEYVNQEHVDPENNLAERVLVGKMIDHAIQSNSTHVWFNLAYPGAYAPFIQILCQQWSSIYSKAWAQSLGRPTMWPGTWGDYTGWYGYHNPAVPTLDDPTPVEMGTGPFILANLDRTNKFWDANRFTNYWRGWGNGPAPNYGVGWPAYGGSKPAGYINHYKVSWAWDWPTRSTMFLAGDVDYCHVPQQYIGSMLGQPNIRCTGPLPSLMVEALSYNFNIDPTSPYGTVYGYGVLNETGVPRDFFGNSTYGKWIRKAFSSAIDYTTFINNALLGEAIQPATAIIPGLPQYDASILKYTYNLTKAEEYLKKWPGLWNTGFTMQLVYDTGHLARQTLTEMLRDVLNGMNPKFHITSVGVSYSSYAGARHHGQLALFMCFWWPDYADAHNYAYAFYHSYGSYAGMQGYSSASMDALIEQGIATPNGPARNLIYKQIQQLVIDDCPSVALYQPVGRHFEQSWMCGWYYNPMYWGSGSYPANQWKWYYTPHAQQDSIPANSTGNQLPYDYNYDGKVNGRDIGATARSFGAVYGPPMSARWNFRCDVNNDRVINMKDISLVAKNFGKTSATWVPSS